MDNIYWLWLIPALPLLGSAICGLIHFATLSARRRDSSASGPAGLAPWIASLAVGGSLALLFKGNILANLGLLYIWPRPLYIFAIAVFALFVSLTTGVLAGLYPAMKSARLEPYDSIRRGER